MKVIVINCGGSSIRHQIRDVSPDQELAKGIVPRIGESRGFLEGSFQGGNT